MSHTLSLDSTPGKDMPPVGEVSTQGLSEAEATARRERGEGNNVKIQTSRTYGQILSQNVFTFINMALFFIGFVMILLGLWGDAIVSVGVIMMNVVVSVVQEFRAKAKLDRIALLTRPKATVIRDGAEKVVDPSEIVLGDVIVAHAGDQIVVDGEIVGNGKIDLDESLLTGESDLIGKRAGDKVMSGSIVVNGSATYVAQKVGADSFANKLTASARQFTVVRTPLQMDINFVVRVLLMTATIIGILFLMAFIVRNLTIAESVQAAAVIAGLVPAGLILMTTTAYAMGAVRMSGRGALIQQSNAVESMSNVNVLCLDKTGTLTANRIKLNEVHAFDGDNEGFKRMLGTYARSTRAGNRTSDALSEDCDGVSLTPVDEVAFSSARKWSAQSFDSDSLRGVVVMGAPEFVAPLLANPGGDYGREMLDDWAEDGLRVLLVAYSPEPVSLYDEDEKPILPDDLKPYGIVSFSDELRPEARETLEGFLKAGIRLKIISGDNPDTVAALAKQAGLPGDIRAVSGTELAEMDDEQVKSIAENMTVFGRITPDQKERLVDSLKGRGYYTAMIGDGVNDVLSLKKAQIGISMQSGSAATRGVADIVLLNDSFAALPAAFMEGQRILNGMGDIIRLFLTRAFYAALVILGVAVVAGVEQFPFIPKHASLLTLLTVGFPTFGLAAWARTGVPDKQIVRSTLRFIIPAAITIAFTALAVYFVYLGNHYLPVEGTPEAEVALNLARTALTTVLVFIGLMLILFAEPPIRLLAVGDEFSGDTRPTIVAALMLIAYFVMFLVEPFRVFWELEPLPLVDFLMIGAVSLTWATVQWIVWRNHLFERFFGRPFTGTETSRAAPEIAG